MTVARTEHFGNLLVAGLSEIFYETFNQIPSLISALYNVQTTGNPDEIDLSIGTMGPFKKFTGSVSYDRPYEGYKKTYEFPEYAGGFQIERKLYDDDRYSVINQRPAGLAISVARRREEDAAFTFVNSFAATGTDSDGNTIDTTGGDGKALCATDHPSKATGGPASRSNKGTIALSAPNLQTTKENMRKTRDDRNGRISVVPDTMLIPIELEETAWELVMTQGKVNSADNNANIHQGKYRVLIWDQLTNAKDWWLIDSAYARMFLKWFDRVPLEFAFEEDFDTLIAKYRAYCRWGTGYSDWIWVYGNDVA